MKKSLFLIPTFAMGLTLASCSNDEPTVNTGAGGDFETNYLTVNLVPAPDATRAAGNSQTGQPAGDGATYEEGYTSENLVESVRFYFFNADGSKATVKADGTNFFDWNNPDTEGADMPNVEKQLQATVVINTQNGDRLPAKMVAVINPGAEGLTATGTAGNMDLSELQSNRTQDYAAAVNAASPSNFVMTNAVYAEGSGSSKNIVNSNVITLDNYGSTPDDAKGKPVNIYVERNVAKVRVHFDPQSGYVAATKRIALKDNQGEAIMVDGKQVYLEVSNWNLTAETDKGNLFKNISTWNDDLFGSRAWNYAPYFRSYWANNATGAAQHWHNFTEISSLGGKDFTGDLANSIYANENAPQTAAASTTADIEPFTKVILAGKLVYETGAYVEVTKYKGLTIVGESNLVASILDNMGSYMIYSYVENPGSDVSFSSLQAEDVEFKTAFEAGQAQAGESTTGRYYVYLQLSATGKSKNWTRTDNKDTYQQQAFSAENNNAAVDSYLISNVGKAQIYSGGLTYYYFPIRHLADEAKVGYYGIVRNHIYDCNIKEVTGLGTPVYRPTETIYPERPTDEDTYIAAQIKILSWRLVNQDVNLNW